MAGSREPRHGPAMKQPPRPWWGPRATPGPVGGQSQNGKARKDDFVVICSQILKASFREGADNF